MKNLCLTFVFLFLGIGAFAQTGLHISILAQPQNTRIFNEESLDTTRTKFKYKATWGYAGMIKIGYNFADPIGIHVGLTYSIQGQDYTSIDSLGVEILTQRELEYIKIPLLLHINSDPGKVMFMMEFGPQIGFIQGAGFIDNGQLLGVPYSGVDLYKPTDLSVTWSIGAVFALTEWLQFTLHHRGDYGLLDFENKTYTFNNERVYAPERDKANLATFGLMGGFTFVINPQGSGRRTQFWFR